MPEKHSDGAYHLLVFSSMQLQGPFGSPLLYLVAETCSMLAFKAEWCAMFQEDFDGREMLFLRLAFCMYQRL